MPQFAGIQPFVYSSEEIPSNVNTMNITITFEHNGDVNINNLSDLSSDISLSNCDSTEKVISKEVIYVCTFCQVFSPHLATVTEHISSQHFELLPVGTVPENFVSKLQPLERTIQKKKAKVGRPRKEPEKSIIPSEPTPVIEPVPDSNGLFWCKKCLRHFKKVRQWNQHICQDSEEELSSEESSFELEEDVEFRTHMDIDPVPWSRRKKKTNLEENISDDLLNSVTKTTENSVSETSEEIVESRVVPNWRNDPSYVPLFDDENEKAAFEKHLKSIDYSCVDDLFQVKEKLCRNKSKNPCLYVQSVVYTCNYCKKSMKSLSHIRLHCLIHTDFKPFTCPKCSYRSNSKGSLYMHMRKHTGNVFCCSFCDFKCKKRSHLLDHEATHSSISQICKLCKNSYKTPRTLIAHIRKYHNHPGGKKYIKALTLKQTKEFKCAICNKKFKSQDILNNHNHACHEIKLPSDRTPEGESQSNQNSEILNSVIEDIRVGNSCSLDHSPGELQCSSMQTKDPLAEIVLNNFLRQDQSHAIMYQNVFNESSEAILPPSNNSLLDQFQTKTVANRLATESSILEECQKTLNLDILNECLQNGNFSNECQNFNLLPNMSTEHTLQSNSSEVNSDKTTHLSDISEDKREEQKSVEIKLFEKCQRAPAYVCCVCSSIYICTSTLKAHLREHVNNTNSPLIDQAEQFEPAKTPEASSELDVCQILQDDTESCSYDEELEKLYTSSLDMMYYLPELSIVLQNDTALFDSTLDDISNFSMSVNSPQDLDTKDEDENVLKCFPGL